MLDNINKKMEQASASKSKKKDKNHPDIIGFGSEKKDKDEQEMLSDIGTEAENEDLAISEPKDAANVQTGQKD